MNASEPREETYLPEEIPAGPLAKVYDFVQAHEAATGKRPEPRYFLAGAEPGDQVELPPELYRMLRQVVDAFRKGLPVTIAPQSHTLTTQQAADLLGVSRPTVVRLLDAGTIPYDRAGSHRRIKLGDLLEYREQRRAEQYAALEATAVELDDDEDLEETLEQVRAARKAVARRRS